MWSSRPSFDGGPDHASRQARPHHQPGAPVRGCGPVRRLTIDWIPFTTLRAQVTQDEIEDVQGSHGELPRAHLTVLTRYVDGVTTAHWLTYEGRVYNIVSTREIGLRKGLELEAVAS